MPQKGKFCWVLVGCAILNAPYTGMNSDDLVTLATLVPYDLVLFVESKMVPWISETFGYDRPQTWHKVVFGEVIGWMAGDLKDAHQG